MLLSFVKSILVGFAASVPLGPIGILCIQKTISKGKSSGIALGVGAAFTDFLWAILCIFFLSRIDTFLNDNYNLVLLIGGLFLLGLGVSLLLSNPLRMLRERKQQQQASKGYATDAFQGFFMSLTNPGAPFLLLSVFAFMHFDPSAFDRFWVAVSLPFGVFIGGLLWWYLLCCGINLVRKWFQLRHLMFLNRISGLAIAVFGLYASVKGILALLG